MFARGWQGSSVTLLRPASLFVLVLDLHNNAPKLRGIKRRFITCGLGICIGNSWSSVSLPHDIWSLS